MNGGEIVASVLQAQGVPALFTLCGGHISPILVACKALGLRVIDTRHEATAVFAADALARLTGCPAVAAVTAGPGVTNTITALQNALMAQSPVVLIGGAAPTALQGRGALQDIDQMDIVLPVVKWSTAVKRVRDLNPALLEAFRRALSGVPGPVFVQCPVDLLYDEPVIRQWYGMDRTSGQGRPKGLKALPDQVTKQYLRYHVHRLFDGADAPLDLRRAEAAPPAPNPNEVERAAALLAAAECPVVLVGSQALLGAVPGSGLAAAVEHLGAPVYLSGMARGLLGRDHPLHLRHKRREALREADVVVLAGVPCDFRLDYGNHIRRSAKLIAANRSRRDLNKNRRPTLGVLGDPALFLRAVAGHLPAEQRWQPWLAQLRERDAARNAEIAGQATQPTAHVNPLHLCQRIDAALGPNSIVIGDGGDFVATASYVVQPHGPLRWLDPGAYGTLGVGAGFALGAKVARPNADIWVLYGDGSAGYSLSEFDTFARHGIPVIAVVGNDAGWSQIAREQVEMLHDDVGTVLAHSDYDRVAAGLGGAGLRVDDPELVDDTLRQAMTAAQAGQPVLVNAILDRTDFRKGSISM